MTSRQRTYQIRNTDEGLCEKCPRAAKIKGLCKRHQKAHNARRATKAFNAKRREQRREKRQRASVLQAMHRPWTFFGLEPPYTEPEVRGAFMRMVRDRRLHPDRGGDEGVFKFLNIMKQAAIDAIVPMGAPGMVRLLVAGERGDG